jgi:hypothetical protein
MSSLGKPRASERSEESDAGDEVLRLAALAQDDRGSAACL